MDMSLVLSIVNMQAGQLQQAVATRMLKMNADAEAFAAQTLLGVQTQSPAQAQTSPGVGGLIDRSA